MMVVKMHEQQQDQSIFIYPSIYANADRRLFS